MYNFKEFTLENINEIITASKYYINTEYHNVYKRLLAEKMGVDINNRDFGSIIDYAIHRDIAIDYNRFNKIIPIGDLHGDLFMMILLLILNDIIEIRNSVGADITESIKNQIIATYKLPPIRYDEEEEEYDEYDEPNTSDQLSFDQLAQSSNSESRLKQVPVIQSIPITLSDIDTSDEEIKEPPPIQKKYLELATAQAIQETTDDGDAEKEIKDEYRFIEPNTYFHQAYDPSYELLYKIFENSINYKTDTKKLIIFTGDLIDGARKSQDNVTAEAYDRYGINDVLMHIIIYNLRLQAQRNESDIIVMFGNHELYELLCYNMEYYNLFTTQMVKHQYNQPSGMIESIKLYSNFILPFYLFDIAFVRFIIKDNKIIAIFQHASIDEVQANIILRYFPNFMNLHNDFCRYVIDMIHRDTDISMTENMLRTFVESRETHKYLINASTAMPIYQNYIDAITTYKNYMDILSSFVSCPKIINGHTITARHDFETLFRDIPNHDDYDNSQQFIHHEHCRNGCMLHLMNNIAMIDAGYSMAMAITREITDTILPDLVVTEFHKDIESLNLIKNNEAGNFDFWVKHFMVDDNKFKYYLIRPSQLDLDKCLPKNLNLVTRNRMVDLGDRTRRLVTRTIKIRRKVGQATKQVQPTQIGSSYVNLYKYYKQKYNYM